MVLIPEITWVTLEVGGGCGIDFEVEPLFEFLSLVYVYSIGLVEGAILSLTDLTTHLRDVAGPYMSDSSIRQTSQ